MLQRIVALVLQSRNENIIVENAEVYSVGIALNTKRSLVAFRKG